jgi:membrane associated rhomboid family serine protease
MGIPISITAPRKRPIVTTLLILANTVVFILMYIAPSLLAPGATSVEDVQRSLSLVPIAVVRGENLWTILTAMFLHANFLHLFFNMLFLFVFGAAVESATGSKRFLILYLLSGLAAYLFHIMSIALMPREYLLTRIILDPWITPVLGASGAISGVMGAYLIYYPRTRVTFIYPIFIIPLILYLPAWVYVLIWFFLQLVMGLMMFLGVFSSVAYWAHVGGFLAGVALAPYLLDPRIKLWIRIRRMLLRYRGRDIMDYYYDEEFF